MASSWTDSVFDPEPDVRWAALGHREEQGGRARAAAILKATDERGRVTTIVSVERADAGEVDRLATLTAGRSLATGHAADADALAAEATWDVVPDPEGQPGAALVCLSLAIRPEGRPPTWTVLRLPVPRFVPGLEGLCETRRLLVTTASLADFQARGAAAWAAPAYVVRFGEPLDRVAAVCDHYRALGDRPGAARQLLGERAALWERLAADLPEVYAWARAGGLAVMAGFKTVSHPDWPGFAALVTWVEPTDGAELRRLQQAIDAGLDPEVAIRYRWHAVPPDRGAPDPRGLVTLSWATLPRGGAPRWLVVAFPLPEQLATLRAIATYQATQEARYRPAVMVMAREPVEDEDWAAPNVVLNLGRTPAPEARAMLDWYRRHGGAGPAG
jgi:hypothetical protein